MMLWSRQQVVDVARCESNTISTSAHAAADQLIRLKRSSTTLNLIIIIIIIVSMIAQRQSVSIISLWRSLNCRLLMIAWWRFR